MQRPLGEQTCPSLQPTSPLHCAVQAPLLQKSPSLQGALSEQLAPQRLPYTSTQLNPEPPWPPEPPKPPAPPPPAAPATPPDPAVPPEPPVPAAPPEPPVPAVPAVPPVP